MFRSAFIEEIDDEDAFVIPLGPETDRSHYGPAFDDLIPSTNPSLLVDPSMPWQPPCRRSSPDPVMILYSLGDPEHEFFGVKRCHPLSV